MGILHLQGEFGDYYTSSYDSSNALNDSQRKVNAIYINSYLQSKGWTLESICGCLGNFQAEAALNPGRWQSDNPGNMSAGYGLAQWTPATKYINWIGVTNHPEYIDHNLKRLIYELNNHIQYYATKKYPETFYEYTQSKKSPEYLAAAWVYNYERPGVINTGTRQRYARNWYNYLGGNIPPTPIIKSKRFKWFLYFNKIRKRTQID